MKRIYLIISGILVACSLLAQQESADVRKGNKQYEKQDYTAAEVNYRRGLEKNNKSFEGHYNLGNSLFKQNKYAEAEEAYQKASQFVATEGDKKQISDSYHNLGNALFAQQQYDKAIAAYQESLRHNPKDNDTRYNLVKAMQMLEKQQQQQQQQQQEKKEEKQEKQQEQQNEQQKPQEQEQSAQPQEPQESAQKMDKETAEQILQALEQDEKETQEKLQRQQGKKRRVEKDW